MRLARLLVGYREDLDLTTRWWHRLLKVLTAVFLLATSALVGLLAIARRPSSIPLREVTIVADLRSFTSQARPDIPNTIPSFLALSGELGGIKDGQVVFVSSYLLERDICSADLVQHAEAVAVSANTGVYERAKQVTAEQVRQSLQDELKNKRPDEEKRYCLISNDIGLRSDAIIKYQFTLVANAKHYGSALAKVAAVISGIGFVLLNVYYRGLVYIICGPRRN